MIVSWLATLAEADTLSAAAIRNAAGGLSGANNDMHGFFPIALASLGIAVDLATAALIAAGVIRGAALVARCSANEFGGLTTPKDVLYKILDVFRSEDGPGQYEPRNHHISERAADYQEQVTGSLARIGYVVDGRRSMATATAGCRMPRGPDTNSFSTRAASGNSTSRVRLL